MPASKPSVVLLVANLVHFKKQEEDAKAARIAAEEALIAAVGFRKPEGQESYEFEDGSGHCKFTLKQPINRSVDEKKWPEIFALLSGEDQAAVESVMRTKYELAAGEARELEKNRPNLWRRIAACVSSKPGKVSVEIKESLAL